MNLSVKEKKIQELLKDLNSQQRKAVIHGKGPLLIIAGAGTGKTKVITHRIAYLIVSKLARPEEILAVTFTEKAANEMEERVDVLIPYSFSFVEISTFNSFGERVLRNYGHEIGYPPDFRLLDEVEQAIFFREHLFDFPLEYFRPLSNPNKYIQELLSAVKRLKQEDITPEEYIAYSREAVEKASDEAEKDEARKHLEMSHVYQKYQELLKAEGKIDFEDQVNVVLELFRKRPSVLREYQNRYRFILVDEFQDTNYIQFELLKMLVAKHRNLTVVGDDDQSIFRFRGASLTNIQNFKCYYPDYDKVVLTKNYRSAQPILDSAYRLIQHNNPGRLEFQEKIDKKLVSINQKEEKSLYMITFDTLSHEADRVAQLISEKIEEGYKPKDIAILVRRNADADPFLRSLNMKNIPFRFSGSRGLYSRKEVRIIISFIRALNDFDDSSNLYNLALSEIYKVNPYDLALLANSARKRNVSLHNVFKEVAKDKSPVPLSDDSKRTVKEIFEDLIYFLHYAVDQNAGRVVFRFLEKSGYIKELVEKGDLESEVKIKNIRVFFDKIKNFSQVTDNDSIHNFAQHLDILQEVGDNPATAEAELEEDAVNVLTVHKAKGLEFAVVFMVSLIADRFPGRERKEKIPIPDKILKENLPENENYIQEERRLFYVGMTRSKELLYLTWARDYGLKRLKKISPFVLEALDLPKIPDECQKRSALEEIKRYAPPEESEIPQLVIRKREKLYLSYVQVDDYLACPLKYKYRHIIGIPLLPHHNLVFGRVMHGTIHYYLKKKISGQKITEKELIKEYQGRWTSEGFLSREHEEMRKKIGEEALRQFYRREEKEGRIPTFLEKKFRFSVGDIKFTGRWDRVDVLPKGAVIIDFKASAVKDQKEADKKTRDSLQMDLYAYSFLKTQDTPLLGTQLYFLESGFVGFAEKTDVQVKKAEEKILEVKEGISSWNFSPTPGWHTCQYCEFRTICPHSYAY